MRPRTFLQALLRSISSPQYYLDVLNSPFKFSVRFFLMGYFLLSLLATVFFVQIDIPHFENIFSQNAADLIKNYPRDLVVQWDGKELHNSNPQLVQIQYPKDVPHQGLPEKLAYINSSASSVEEVTKEAKSTSLFAVSKNTLYVSKNQGGWSPLLLTETPGFAEPFTITKENLPQFISTWKNIFTTSLQAFAFIYPFCYFFIIGFFRVISLMVSSCFIFYLLRLFGKALPYTKVLQLGLHVIVVAGLLEILTVHFLPDSADPGIFGISFWLYMILIIFSLWNVKNVVLFRPQNKK